MCEHEIIFDRIISEKFITIKAKAVLVVMGAVLPTTVKIITPNEKLLIRIK